MQGRGESGAPSPHMNEAKNVRSLQTGGMEEGRRLRDGLSKAIAF
jgi:hypothetical protein